MRSQKTILTTLFAAALLASTPTLAQPTGDLFEAIVNNPSSANERLRNTAIEFRNPTREELEQGLKTFKRISTTIRIKTGNRSGHLGLMRVASNTMLDINVVMLKRGTGETVLENLEVVPNNSIKAFGLLAFQRLDYDPHKEQLKGTLALEVGHLRQAWGEEVYYEKIYTDSQGNNVFQAAGGKGISGWLNKDLRQTPDGTLQYKSGGFLNFGWGWLGAGWKDVPGNPPKVPNNMTFPNWPPRTSDLLQWLSEPGKEGEVLAENLKGLAPLLGSIPVEEISIHFDGQTDPGRIRLSDGEGYVDLNELDVKYDANGTFQGRTYVADLNKPNTFRVKAHVLGEVQREGLGSTDIEQLDIDLQGTHGGQIPFSDPTKVDVWGKYNATVDGELRDSDVGLPGMPTLSTPGRMLVDANTSGTVHLRPLDSDPANRTRMVIDEGSRYGVKVVDGTLEIDDLSATIPSDRIEFTKRLVIAPKDGKPILTAEGELGTREDDSVGARTHIVLEGKTTKAGAIHLIEDIGTGTPALTATLKPGANIQLEAHTLGSINPNNLQPGPVHLTAATNLNGVVENTAVGAQGHKLTLPGETALRTRIATDLTIETPRAVKPKAAIDEVAAHTNLTLLNDGAIEGGLPGKPHINGSLAKGSNVQFNTGRMTRRTATSPALSTNGKSAELKGRLILGDARLSNGETDVEFDGETAVDVDAKVGFAMNPTEGRPVGTIESDLNVVSQVSRGSTITIKNGGRFSTRVNLGGATKFTFKAKPSIDPVTRKMHASGVDVTIEATNMDLRAMLGNTVASDSVDARSVVRIRDATVSFLRDGRMKIHHKRITLDIDPGTITIGTPSR